MGQQEKGRSREKHGRMFSPRTPYKTSVGGKCGGHMGVFSTQGGAWSAIHKCKHSKISVIINILRPLKDQVNFVNPEKNKFKVEKS